MAQIARNAAIDVKRLKSFENERNIISISDQNHEIGYQQTTNSVDLEALTKKMPEKYKILLDKMFLSGYTQQEISEELNIPLGTVKTRLREALNILRENLKNEKNLLYLLSIIV